MVKAKRLQVMAWKCNQCKEVYFSRIRADLCCYDNHAKDGVEGGE